MLIRRAGKTAFLFPVLMIVLASSAHAQASTPNLSRSEEGVYSLAAIGASLPDALELVIDQTNINLVYESHLVAGRTSYCKIRDATERDLLSCILRDTGLDFFLLSSGTYVLRPDARTAPLRGDVIGQVLNAESGLPIAGANVLVVGSKRGTATNSDGRFTLAGLLPGPHRLVVSHVAFDTGADSVEVISARTEQVSISVRPRMLLSSPIVITGFEEMARSDRLGSSRSADVQPIARATDLSQDVGSLMGVRLGDVDSDVHVQGGGSNEQQLMLEGAPIFMPVPSGGFISLFSPFAVDQITIHKAGFGVEHGSHLSGVIDVSHDLAATPSASVRVDPLSLNAKLDGSAQLGGSTEAVWMVSGRRGIWDTYHPQQLGALFRSWARPDVFLRQVLEAPGERPVTTEESGDVADAQLEVGFTDLHGTARLSFGELRSLRVTVYRGANSFGIDEVVLPDGGGVVEFEDAYRWKNRAADVRYEWVASSRLLMNAEGWASDYVLEHPTTLAGAAATDLTEEFNQIREIGVRLSGDAALSARSTVYAGAEVGNVHSRFALALDPFGASVAGASAVRPVIWRAAAFAEERLALSRTTRLELGTRLTYLPAQQNLFAEPRIALRWDGRRVSARAALGLYRQFVHSFDVATYNVASLLPRVRFWLPIGKEQRPPEAYHAAAATSFRPDDRWTGTLEAFYKHQPHLLVLNYGLPESQERPLFADADGFAYGLGLKISRRTERLNVQAQYEYTMTKRSIEHRFGDRFLSAPWNAPHRFGATLDAVPIAPVTLTARWQAAVGRSWGFRQVYYDVLAPNAETREFGSFDLSDPEAHRLPATVQLDVGAAYIHTIGSASIQARLYVINALGTRNVSDWTLRYVDGAYVRHERRGMPFFPAASITVRFDRGVPQ